MSAVLDSFAARVAALERLNPTHPDNLVTIDPAMQRELDRQQRLQDADDLLQFGKRRTFADLVPRIYHASRPTWAPIILYEGLEPRLPFVPDPTGVYLGLGFALLHGMARCELYGETDVFILEIDTSKLDASKMFIKHDEWRTQFVNVGRNPRAAYAQLQAGQGRHECFSRAFILPDAFVSCVRIPIAELREILEEIHPTLPDGDGGKVSIVCDVALQWIFHTRRMSIEDYWKSLPPLKPLNS